MNRPWLISIFIIAIFLISSLKSHELCALKPFFKAERSVRLSNFAQAKKGLSPSDQDLLELWESILTGRSAPVNKWMKQQYKSLALNHLFTPSGFHLSAVLLPVNWFINAKTSKLGIYLLIALALFFIPGMGALKRMLLVKTGQLLTSQKLGFAIAMLLDLLVGQFTNSPLSFSYSFLFLGIIYSGVKGASLIVWFFLAQLLLAYFQANTISPLLLLLSPILNFGFGLMMPVLVLLAIPLWNWQLHTGLFLLKLMQGLVELASELVHLIPLWEVHVGLLMMALLLLLRQWKLSWLSLLFLCSSLNLDLQKDPSLGSHEFRPQGNIIRIISKDEEDLVYFKDGKCNRKLVRGMWWERCSPLRRRGSSKKLMKLSYPSSEQRKSSLRGLRTSSSS